MLLSWSMVLHCTALMLVLVLVLSWLFCFRRIGAHGILADDMGLGKTLQALMAVAMCHHHYPGASLFILCKRALDRCIG